jgi:hypothetical protein
VLETVSLLVGPHCIAGGTTPMEACLWCETTRRAHAIVAFVVRVVVTRLKANATHIRRQGSVIDGVYTLETARVNWPSNEGLVMLGVQVMWVIGHSERLCRGIVNQSCVHWNRRAHRCGGLVRTSSTGRNHSIRS